MVTASLTRKARATLDRGRRAITTSASRGTRPSSSAKSAEERSFGSYAGMPVSVALLLHAQKGLQEASN